MTQTTSPISIHHIEDHEGAGECQQCGRTNLRWIAILSDGSRCGTECAKRVLGYSISRKSYEWVADFTPVAEHTECGDTFVMWQRKGSAQTAETRNGLLVSVGGTRSEWIAKGWVA